MRPLLTLTLLALTVPALAQSPAAPVSAPPAATAAAASGPPAALLDPLVGKPQIIGITETSGTRFLGRIVSGDHGMYVVQTFHFAGPPHVTTRNIAAVPAGQQAHTRSYTTGSGRNRRRVQVVTYTPVAAKKAQTVQTKSDTTLPDDQAVRLLLQGVAGPTLYPREIPDVQQMVATKDVKYLQTLSPAAKDKAATPASSGPFQASATTPKKSGWVMTMLWPTDLKSADTPSHGGRKRGHH